MKLMKPNRIYGKQSRRGAVLQITLAVIAAAVVGTLAVSSSTTTTTSMRHRRADPPPMSNIELDVALRRTHLGPEELTAIGLNQAGTTALVGRARAGLSGTVTSLRSADQGRGDAQRELDRLERLVRSGLGTENDVTALATARTTLTSAVNTQQEQLDNLIQAAAGEALSSDQLITLATIRANSVWDIPIEYRCRSGNGVSEADWVALRGALANQRIAARDGGQVTEANQAILDAWAQNPAVAAARSNLTQSLTAVTAAYNAAIAGPG